MANFSSPTCIDCTVEPEEVLMSCSKDQLGRVHGSCADPGETVFEPGAEWAVEWQNNYILRKRWTRREREGKERDRGAREGEVTNLLAFDRLPAATSLAGNRSYPILVAMLEARCLQDPKTRVSGRTFCLVSSRLRDS